MSSVRRLVEELSRMRAVDQELLNELNTSEPSGLDLDERRETLRELNIAARIDQGVIDHLKKLPSWKALR